MIHADNVKALLKKLFAVADNDASTDGEITAAMSIANRLMAQHQIERDDVFENEAGEVSVSNVAYGKASRYSLYVSICAWESIVCQFITSFVPGTGYFVQKGVIRRNRAGMATNSKATLITFYGAEQDVQFCCDIFDELNCFIQSAAHLRFGAALSRGDAAAYAEGFAAGLRDANKRESVKIEQASRSGDCRALAVVNRSLALKDGATEWLRKEQGIRLMRGRAGRSAATRSFGAYEQGRSDGSQYKPGVKRKAGYIS